MLPVLDDTTITRRNVTAELPRLRKSGRHGEFRLCASTDDRGTLRVCRLVSGIEIGRAQFARLRPIGFALSCGSGFFRLVVQKRFSVSWLFFRMPRPGSSNGVYRLVRSYQGGAKLLWELSLIDAAGQVQRLISSDWGFDGISTY